MEVAIGKKPIQGNYKYIDIIISLQDVSELDINIFFYNKKVNITFFDFNLLYQYGHQLSVQNLYCIN